MPADLFNRKILPKGQNTESQNSEYNIMDQSLPKVKEKKKKRKVKIKIKKITIIIIKKKTEKGKEKKK